MFAAVAGELPISIAAAGPAQVQDRATDMLADGYEALRDGRDDLARRIFETLATAYPQSPEARKAEAELSRITRAGADGGDENGASDGGPESGPIDDGPETGSHAYGYGDEEQASPTAPATPSASPASSARRPFTSEQIRKARMRFLIEVGDRVFFAESSATIGGRARAILEAQAHWLKTVKSLDVTIIGRAADGGNADENTALSLARAKAVEAKLVEGGLPRDRIRIEARGSGDPVATCAADLCQAQNRHVETLLRLPGDPPSAVSHSAIPQPVRPQAEDSRSAAVRGSAR